MRNFKLILEYDGYGFSGWQFQPFQRTIQGHLEEKITKIFKKKIHCTASGRTDSGVHALCQVVHFKVDTAMVAQDIHKYLNSFLDRDVAVVSVQEVPLDFHAQQSVKNKTYRYTILNRAYPSAFWRNRAYFYPQPLNIKLMRKAALSIKGKRDFKCFQAAAERTKMKTTVRTISQLTISKEDGFIHITITADGFLHHMVRNIIGVLLAVGAGRLSLKDIPRLFKSKDRKLAPATAPAHGLCLVGVQY